MPCSLTHFNSQETFKFISTSTVITHLGRICCHIVIPVNAPKRAFMDNDNSEDLRLTEGGSFSSDIARAGEPEIVKLFYFPKNIFINENKNSYHKAEPELKFCD